MYDKTFQRFVINYYGDLPKILDKIGVDVSTGGLFFCPMHDNYNTPSAKLFKDDTGWHFFCFSEQRQFGTYDVYKSVFGLNMAQVFKTLWENLTEIQRQSMFDLFGEQDTNTPVENLDVYEAFHFGKITYEQMLLLLEKRLDEN